MVRAFQIVLSQFFCPHFSAGRALLSYFQGSLLSAKYLSIQQTIVELWQKGIELFEEKVF
jgi:hypothetical protein